MREVLEVDQEIQLQDITDLEVLESMYPDWLDLWCRSQQPTPFQSPGWLIPLWRHLGEGDLWVVCFRKGERLVGVAPFVIYTQPETRRRDLFLLGTGCSDYLDLLLEPGVDQIVATHLMPHLLSHHSRWDTLDFQQLSSDSPLLEASTSESWRAQVSVQEVCPVLTLPSQRTLLGDSVPARMIEKLAYYRRRISKLGDWQVALATPDTYESCFNAFLALHRARWQSRGFEGVLGERRIQEFHAEAARRFMDAGCLRLYSLVLKGEIIASLYAFCHHQHTYFYLSGFNPEFAVISPGTLLIGHAIEQAIDEHCITFDFLRGRETYKYMWGARGRLNYRRVIHAQEPMAEAA